MTEDDLLPYNSLRACTKCGHWDATTEYVPQGSAVPCPGPSKIRTEYLLRQCRRCGFRWAEAPLNLKPIVPIVEVLK